MFSRNCKTCGLKTKERYKGLCLDCFMDVIKLKCSHCGRLTPINNLVHGDGTDNTGKRFYYCGHCMEEVLRKSIKIDIQEDLERYNRIMKRIQYYSPGKFPPRPDDSPEMKLVRHS